jgi:hypothetical protein
VGGGGGESHSEQFRKRDPDSAEITALQQALYGQFTPMASGVGADYANADNQAKTYQQNYDKAYSGLQDMTDTGNLPSGLTDAMNGFITRSMNKSLGTAMNSAAGKGVLNSSVTGKAINEIGSNTADAFAQNYLNAYNAASGNYGTLMNAASKAKGQGYTDLASKYAQMMDFYKTARNSEDQEDYDTVVYQDGGK